MGISATQYCIAFQGATADVSNVHVAKEGMHHVNYAASAE